MSTMTVTWEEAARRLKAGEVGVVPTDTLYGMVASVRRPEAVERVYELRQREREKPLIVLIGEVGDLDVLGVQADERVRKLCGQVWPGPVSLVMDLPSAAAAYLHRGTHSLAVRMPAKAALRALLREAGPLVAPSANLAGEPPAKTVEEAREHFGEVVWYVDEGYLENPASALVDVRGESPRILRPAPGFDVRLLM